MEYVPDKWLIIKIGSEKIHYRVFATWSGGYLSADSWKLNSGIVSVTEDDNYYYFKGESDSVYKCNKAMRGQSTVYGWSILENLIAQSNNNVIIMDNDFDIINKDWNA